MLPMKYLCLAAIAVMAPTAALSHVGNVVVPIYELAPQQIPDLHDGSLSDWAEELPNAALTHLDFSNPSQIGADDLAFRIFLAWSLGRPSRVGRDRDGHHALGRSQPTQAASRSSI